MRAPTRRRGTRARTDNVVYMDDKRYDSHGHPSVSVARSPFPAAAITDCACADDELFVREGNEQRPTGFRSTGTASTPSPQMEDFSQRPDLDLADAAEAIHFNDSSVKQHRG